MLRDQLVFASKRVSIETRCPLCIYKQHTAFVCPYYHYVPADNLITARYQRKLSSQPRKTHPNPRYRAAKRRARYPWIKMSEEETLVLGSLKQQKLVSLAEMKENKDSGKKVPVKDKTLQMLDNHRPDIEKYLTTVPDVDQAYEWTKFYPKYNIHFN